MGIGNYKQIKLYSYTNGNATVDGNFNTAIVNTYPLWAEIVDEGGGRSLSDGRVNLNDTKTFKIFYRGYNPYGRYRIEYYGENYEIVNARRLDEKRFNWLITGRAIL